MKKLTLWMTFIVMILSISAKTQPKYSARILLIPLDDRPPCLQFTQQMGLIGNTEIVSPPRELLGKFTTPGQSDKIISWMKGLNMKTFNAAIIAEDMLAYGGLVASRVNHVSSSDALKRVKILSEIKKQNPKLLIYAQNVIMRIAPTGDGKNEAYRSKLAEWGEISVATDEKSRNKTLELEHQIPKDVLNDYKLARERDLKVDLKSVEMVKEGVIDYLILSQDDAKPNGVHIADRNKLIVEVKRLGVEEKISIQPGADEVSMLLLARALNKQFNFSPKIKAIYSSEEMSNKVMPYEDRPLHQTVSYHIKATGSREVSDEQDADILFYVFASRFEAGRAESFAEEIENKIKEGKQVIVADIDSRGDVQGGDTKFTLAMEKRGLFPELNGYASWNTAANTIGTALPQGVIFALAKAKLLKLPDVSKRIWTAENWFTFHRVLDDYYYHNLVRAQIKDIVSQNKSGDGMINQVSMQKIKDTSIQLMRKYFHDLGHIYFQQSKLSNNQKNIKCEAPTNLQFDFPWNRTFEAGIDFDMQCTEVKK